MDKQVQVPESFAKQVDLVIVGGGMVGASLALALRDSGLKIAVVEAVAIPDQGEGHYQPSYDCRSTALSWGTRLIYERLGLWQALSQHVTAIRHIHVSDKGRFGVTRLHARDYQVDALGYVVPNAWMGRVLHDAVTTAAQSESTLSWLCPVQVNDIQYHADGAEVSLVSPSGDWQDCIRTRLLVIADGGRSGLAQKLGIEQIEKPYHQHAVIANLSTQKHHAYWAYERFTANGPMAVLPLGENNPRGAGHSALVWTVPKDRVDEVLALDDKAFVSAVQEHFGYRLGPIIKVGERANYPLTLSLAREQVRQGVVVMGNAAHALHPVAGQGYNLALRDVMALSEVLCRAVAQGEDISSLAVLQRYVQQQTTDQALTIGFSDRVTRLFSNDHGVLGALRDVGLVGLDLMPGLKTQFARHAMGIGGREARWVKE